MAYLEQMFAFLVRHDQAELVDLCPGCVREKNRPVQGGLPAWAQGEGWEEVTITALVPLDQPSGIVSCRRGHRHPWERAVINGQTQPTPASAPSQFPDRADRRSAFLATPIDV